MFNFILRNSVLSVPIVNGTKFIVLFLSSLGNFLLKKKRQRLLSVSSGQLKAVISVFGLGEALARVLLAKKHRVAPL